MGENMIRPVPLKKGDKVGLIGPASPSLEERIPPAIKAVEDMGLIPVLGESVNCAHGYLSGSDEIRAHDINRMFCDKSISGIFAMRGGYGCGRILEMIDYKMIRKNPKVFVGYSDLTAIHNVLNKKCKLITFHGPMPATEFYKGVDEYTLNSFMDNIFNENEYGELCNPEDMEMKTLVSGCAIGNLAGGNLTLVAASMGTPYEVDTRGKILFLEDVGEYPFRIDRMLLQLKQCNKFKDAKGIILGSWTDCKAADPEKSLTLMEIFKELIVPENKPVIYNACFGHCLPTMTLPMGAQVCMNADTGKIRILE